MSKLQIKATELVDTDVQLVSLVKRGANRIPFRIVKEDNTMIDLHKLGLSLFKKAEQKPEIVAALVAKDADLKKVAEIFKAADLDVKTFLKKEEETFISLSKADADKAEDVAVLKVSDDVSFVVSGLKKAFSGYAGSSTSFGEVLATEGFYASCCNATQALGSTIHNALYEASTPSDASTAISKAVEEFKSYVTTLVNALPVQAFKADVEITRAGTVKADIDANVNTAAEPSLNGGAGQNGTGAGVEHGKGTGTDAAATSDDATGTEIDSTGEPVHGNPDEAPVNAKKEDDKDESKEKDKDEDVEKEEAKKEEISGLPQPDGHEPGDEDGFAAAPADTDRAEAAGSADDKKQKLNGGTTGSSIPDGTSGLDRYGGVHKNEGDEDVGKPKDKNQLDDDTSGAGAQQSNEKDQHKKSDNADVMAAIADLAKSVKESIEAVKSDVAAVNDRVEAVATLARKTDAELNGTVFSDAGGDRLKVHKAETSAPPLLDTAYARNGAA